MANNVRYKNEKQCLYLNCEIYDLFFKLKKKNYSQEYNFNKFPLNKTFNAIFFNNFHKLPT